ncbi:MAG: hypothetical protein ABR974_05555 [Bacteroidales bacterium]|jgi:hypothetical protein
MSWAKKILILLILTASLLSCKKSTENIIWERSYGTGKAAFIRSSGDTGFVSCGTLGGKEYLLVVDNNGNKISDYKSERDGLLTSAWTGDGYYIMTGATGGKMFISEISFNGTVLYDTIFNSSFTVEHSTICYLGTGSFIAVGSADPDSSYKNTTGVSFVKFDGSSSTITITQKTDSVYSSFVAMREAVTDNSGNLYLAMTRSFSGAKMKAEVSKYNSDFQKLWEKELYNNPAYSAASLGIMIDDGDNPIVVGRTELPVSTGVENNTFVARYFFQGDSIQKEYLEYANSGSSVMSDGTGEFMVLNMNCLIVDIMNQNIKVAGIIRMYSSCDSQTTDAFGYSMALTKDGNIIMAGSKGNGYYIVVKSSAALSPV